MITKMKRKNATKYNNKSMATFHAIHNRSFVHYNIVYKVKGRNAQLHILESRPHSGNIYENDLQTDNIIWRDKEPQSSNTDLYNTDSTLISGEGIILTNDVKNLVDEPETPSNEEKSAKGKYLIR